ncbi:MAG: ABC transporter ATP-binding protein/permease [Gammaproteobacteria bacterium]|jgi:ATP-binding cassette, subfamily B, heavy metal transporter|nr:ABC transporter ATP-binding protein/permease [Gammaproteobacteria bacterium]
MRGHGDSTTKNSWSGDWTAIKSLVPYFMEFKGRVFLALLFLLLAKLASVMIPFAMKHIVDALDSNQTQIVVVPILFLGLYGLLRLGTILFGEIRDTIFGRVTERAMHRIGLKLFQHLHKLDLDFHLSRRTGGMARDIERGTNGINFLMRFMLFNIIPTLLEISLITIILFTNYSAWYALIILIAVILYIAYSVILTEKRTDIVRQMNEMDNQTNTRAIDSLLNFETVKYFGNEDYEARQYDQNLTGWENARARNRLSMAALNSGQAFVIAASITAMMTLAAYDVSAGKMTLGDLVLVNAYMMQLFIPLNFLGFVYREIKKSLADIEHMFSLLGKEPKIKDEPDAGELVLNGGEIRFENVSFGYKEDRQILSDISFEIPAGKKVAVVGPSGAGKSTIARLLFRFYDVDEGRITINRQDIRSLTQQSLRSAIGVVPQDTVLFNNNIYYNIAYGRPEASKDDIEKATQLAHLEQFISKLPEGYDTLVGERGLKVSGGEKQRIAIARMLLKNPGIMVFDEATSSLDSSSEQAILEALSEVAESHTTLVIAHRLSTIVDADNIVVLDQGRVVEQGTHVELLEKQGIYSSLWELQQREARQPDELLSMANIS